MCLSHGSQLSLLLEMPVAIIQEYGISRMLFSQQFPIGPAGEWITLPTDSMRAYFDICIIKYFLNVISPNNDMQSKLTWLFIRFPEIDLKALGFPQGWETEPLWR